MSKSKKTTPACIVWFEIPADKPERAKEFYGKLFAWEINPFPTMPDYHYIDTVTRFTAKALPENEQVSNRWKAFNVWRLISSFRIKRCGYLNSR